MAGRRTAPAAPATRAAITGSPKTLVFQAKLALGGAQYEWRCDRYPRLVQSYYRGTRTATAHTTWIVDGVRCRDLDEAVCFLNGPVIPADLFETRAS